MIEDFVLFLLTRNLYLLMLEATRFQNNREIAFSKIWIP